jgi:hypothetical protein
MKTISLSVSDEVYESFRHAADRQGRSIAEMVHDAMAFYHAAKPEPRQRLERVTIFPGHRSIAELPSRAEIYDEIHGVRTGRE